MSKDILPDNLLKEALRKAQEMKTSAYDKEIVQEEEHVFSKEYREKMEKLLEEFENKQESKEEKKIYSIKKKNMKLKILLIAAIVMLMGAMTVLAVEPLRESWYHFVEKVFSDHTSVKFEEKGELDNKTNITKENFEFRKIKYLPPNYKLKDEYYIESICEFSQTFVNDEGQVIVYEQSVIGKLDTWLVTSNGNISSKLDINGNLVYWIRDEENYNIILYPFEGYVYSVSGYNSVDELIDILESAF